MDFCIKKAGLLLLLFSLYVSSLYGQSVTARFENDTITAEQGATFTNFLVVKNTGASVVGISGIAPSQKYPGLLFYPAAGFALEPGKEKRLPVKFLANTDFLKMSSDALVFNISYDNGGNAETAKASFLIQKNEDRSIAIYSPTQENYMVPGAEQTTILVFVENRAYSARSLQLNFQSVPDGLIVTPLQQNLSLAPLEKRQLEIRVSSRRAKDLFPEYSLQITATDLLDNEKVGSAQISLVLLTSNRQIVPGMRAGGSTNYAEVAYSDYSSGYNLMQLKGNTEFAADKNLFLKMNLNADYYINSGLYNLYDTWAELATPKTLWRVGNVQGNDYDYSVSGRGGKFGAKLGEGRELEVLAVDNNYSLFGTYAVQGMGSKMAGTKYSFSRNKKFSGKLSYLFDDNDRLATQAQVADFVSALTLNEKHKLRIETGVSHERGKINGDSRAGLSLGLNYDTQIGPWEIRSLNSYATAGYAGLSRGSLFFNESVSRSFAGNKRVSAGYEYSEMRPEYLSIQYGDAGLPYPYYFYGTQAFRLGYQFSAGRWNFQFSPQVEQQENETSFGMRKLFAYRLQSNVGTVLGAHGFNLTTEYSYANDNIRADWFNALRATLTYRIRKFSMNATAQWNPTNVSELATYGNPDRNFANYYLNAAYNFSTAGSSLSGTFSAGLNYSELYNNLNSNMTGYVEYKISNDWAATGYVNYSDYRSTLYGGYSGNNSQFRIGLKRYLPVATAQGNYRVKFQLFQDTNGNGVLDSGERVVANERVMLDKYVAVTDSKGRVTFENVPEGNYRLRLHQTASSRLMTDPEIAVYKNISKQLGLVKSTKVTGKLVEIRQAYDKVETSATGIAVYAKDETGEVFTTVVDQDNEFEFFLKDGIYEVFINNDRYTFVKPSQTVKVESGTDTLDLLFEYKKKGVEIKVKKF
ncbi:MAG: hypothetical protein EAS48_03910 [Chryseobacterium sp.]|nr:MAG: hypothetical protein EAS48_03910 [Chryseobacterium sp.]